jgi:hypothetical protein
VHREAVPDLSTDLLTEQIGKRLAAMDVEVIHYQVDGPGSGILERKLEADFGEFGAGAIRRGEGEVATGLRFHGAEDVGGALFY